MLNPVRNVETVRSNQVTISTGRDQKLGHVSGLLQMTYSIAFAKKTSTSVSSSEDIDTATVDYATGDILLDLIPGLYWVGRCYLDPVAPGKFLRYCDVGSPRNDICHTSVGVYWTGAQ